MCGTYDSPKNSLSIWTNLNETPDEANVLGINKVKNTDYYVNSNVNNIVNYDKRSVLVSLENGDILMLKYARDSGFEAMFKLDGKKDLANHGTTGLIVNDAKEAISCGLDGSLRFIDLHSKTITKTYSITHNSVHCLDKCSPNEVICGTTTGQVKLFDKRTQSIGLTLTNDSVITAIQRNSHIPHIIACANDLGFLYLWDLRNGGQRPMQPASAHMGAINCIRYAENQPNLLFTSSIDGQLIKWNISNDFEINSVEAIIDKSNPYPINCFDINAKNQLVLADDNEVLYLTTGH